MYWALLFMGLVYFYYKRVVVDFVPYDFRSFDIFTYPVMDYTWVCVCLWFWEINIWLKAPWGK